MARSGDLATTIVRDVGTEAGAEGEPWLVEAVTREPGPLDALILVDQIETLLRGLPPQYCHVLDLRLQGCGTREIASHLDVSRSCRSRKKLLPIGPNAIEKIARIGSGPHGRSLGTAAEAVEVLEA